MSVEQGRGRWPSRAGWSSPPSRPRQQRREHREPAAAAGHPRPLRLHDHRVLRAILGAHVRRRGWASKERSRRRGSARPTASIFVSNPRAWSPPRYEEARPSGSDPPRPPAASPLRRPHVVRGQRRGVEARLPGADARARSSRRSARATRSVRTSRRAHGRGRPAGPRGGPADRRRVVPARRRGGGTRHGARRADGRHDRRRRLAPHEAEALLAVGDERLGIVLDTAHLFAAGVALDDPDGVDALVQELRDRGLAPARPRPRERRGLRPRRLAATGTPTSGTARSASADGGPRDRPAALLGPASSRRRATRPASGPTSPVCGTSRPRARLAEGGAPVDDASERLLGDRGLRTRRRGGHARRGREDARRCDPATLLAALAARELVERLALAPPERGSRRRRRPIGDSDVHEVGGEGGG